MLTRSKDYVFGMGGGKLTVTNHNSNDRGHEKPVPRQEGSEDRSRGENLPGTDSETKEFDKELSSWDGDIAWEEHARI